VVVLVDYPMHAQDKILKVVPASQRQITTLADLNNAFVDIAKEVKPTVVTVSTEKILTVPTSPFGGGSLFDFFFGPGQGQQQQPQERKYHQQGLGSGVIVASDGVILTNNHVVDGADSIYVRTFEGHKYRARVVGTDPKTDIAVLRIDAKDLPRIAIGNSDSLRVGEMVMAIGSPMSEELAYTVTQGIVSATGRSNVGLTDYEDFIQTDAAINPGNSGGPLINMNGELVGLNAAIISRSGGFQGIGFAVPSNMAAHIMDMLLTTGKVTRGWLGVSIQDVSQQIASAMHLPEQTGALVGDVLSDSPAEKAGLKAGDLILTMNGDKIKNSSEVRNQIASTAPGTTVTFGILRDAKNMKVTVTLGEMPAEIAAAGPGGIQKNLGFAVQTLTPALSAKYGIDKNLSGVVVTAIDQNSNAYQQGLRQGDLIEEVDQQEVATSQKFNSLVAKKKPGDTLLLRVFRQGSRFYLAFSL
jgi:serine protease Do